MQILRSGTRGSPGGTSLAKLLTEQRNVRNKGDLAPLTIKQILAWVDEHWKRTSEWPNAKSGPVKGTSESWLAIDAQLRRGGRGLLGGSSLAQLLAMNRSVRNHLDLPPLSIEQVLIWADAHFKSKGRWPNQSSGHVTGTEETWGGIYNALRRGRRGLPGGSSLSKLLGARVKV